MAWNNIDGKYFYPKFSIHEENQVNEAMYVGKKGQEKTMGITKRRHEGGHLAVDVSPNLMRAVGNNAQALITELGIIVRQMAPLQFSKWKGIPGDENNKMWQATKEEPYIKEVVYQKLNSQYRDYRHKLHKSHYCKYDSDEMRLENPPLGVSHDDCVDLVRYFGFEDFKKMSKRNKENQRKHNISHIAGMKAFARINYDSVILRRGMSPPGLTCGSLFGLVRRKTLGWIQRRKKSMRSFKGYSLSHRSWVMFSRPRIIGLRQCSDQSDQDRYVVVGLVQSP